MSEKKCLVLPGHGEELRAALVDLGEQITLHEFSPTVDGAMVTIGDVQLAELRTRFPTLHVEEDVYREPPSRHLF